MATRTPRPNPKVSAVRAKRPAMLNPKVEHVDYKDVALLRRFVSDRGKIRSRRVTGLSPQQQRRMATAVRNAREMALLPYPGAGKRSS
ncbi:30S ribosomal protein S18 [Nakamurella flavida]|uniref:Small ribosomal subunit protein bS18 n=1 Tax=Nakamurella flavida TaxID=363630 RepID=A0A938YMY3_9ACTN|nr:30S ribosomal protein S18 [Nakamurella flavida]MDP9778554.1 small subunit ribosomal protein S18 [Nakamurella flavida]